MSLSSSRRYPRSPSVARRLEAPHPQVVRAVRQVALAGVALVLVWPAGRGYSQWLGWLPMWLAGMPLLAWWALYRFRLPAALLARQGTRRRGPQARRRGRARARQTRPDLRQGGASQPV